MGEVGGFLRMRAPRTGRSAAGAPSACTTYRRVTSCRCPPRELQRAGRALHGLRHPVLPLGLPAREPDPGLERPVYRGRWRGRDRRRSRHQQLPRVHRPHLPRAVRGRLRARHQRRRRSRSSRSSSRSSTAPSRRAGSSPSRRRSRTGRTVAVIGSGPAGLAAAAELNQRGPPGHAVRAQRPHRRPAALRRAGLQARQARRAAARRPDRGRGHRVAHGRGGRRRHRRPTSCASSSTRSCICTGSTIPRDLPVPGPRARRRALRDGVPRAAQPLRGGRRRAGRRRSAPRASTWSSSAAATPAPTASATRTARSPRASRSSSCCREPPPRAPGRPHALAALAADPAHLARPRGGRRAPLQRDDHRADRQRRPRHAPARPRGRPRRPSSTKIDGSEFTIHADLVLLAMGFLHPQHEALSSSSASISTAAATSPRRSTRRRCPASSRPATRAAASRSIVWAINEGRQAARAADTYLSELDEEPGEDPVGALLNA